MAQSNGETNYSWVSDEINSADSQPFKDVNDIEIDSISRNIEVLELKNQLKSKTFECSVWKNRAFQLAKEVMLMR